MWSHMPLHFEWAPNAMELYYHPVHGLDPPVKHGLSTHWTPLPTGLHNDQSLFEALVLQSYNMLGFIAVPTVPN